MSATPSIARSCIAARTPPKCARRIADDRRRLEEVSSGSGPAGSREPGESVVVFAGDDHVSVGLTNHPSESLERAGAGGGRIPCTSCPKVAR